MTGNLQLALNLRAEGMARSVDSASDQLKRDFDRVLGTFLTAGLPFSADSMRDLLDAADIPTSKRGGLIQRAIKAGLIEPVGFVRSTWPATHGKHVAVYAPVGATAENERRAS